MGGIVTRVRPELARSEASSCRGVPTLSPAAVLVELAAVLPREELAAACHEAGVRYDVTPRDVARILERYPRSRGAAELRRVMSGETRVALSRVESKLVERLIGADLPLPVTNRPAGGRRVDCRWPEYRLTVELDSYRYHRSRQAWERDRLREREARLRGDEFRRYTWNDVMDEPDWMLRELRSLLGPSRRAAPPRARAA